MNLNSFFKKIKINDIFQKINFDKNLFINNVKPLHLANKNDLTFFDPKYKPDAIKHGWIFVLQQSN